MRKFYLLFTLLAVVGGISVFAANIEFKMVNPAYQENPGYTQQSSFSAYKKERELLDESTNEDGQKKQNTEQPPLPKGVTNYSVYSPNEYTPANYDREAVLFIIDFSGSMLDKVAGKQKITMAIDTMQNILRQLPPKSQLGLRIYGHRSSVTPLNSCQASDLVVPVAPNNAQRIYSELNKAKAKGNTPITYSLKQAVEKDLSKFTGRKRIILLTDGGENCDESPCTYVVNNLANRDDISIDVIAFDINNKEANAQLKCTAMVSNGRFYKADTETQLVNSLNHSLNIEKDVQGVIIKDVK